MNKRKVLNWIKFVFASFFGSFLGQKLLVPFTFTNWMFFLAICAIVGLLLSKIGENGNNDRK